MANLNYVNEEYLRNFLKVFDFFKHYGVSYKDTAEKLGLTYNVVNTARNRGHLTYENYLQALNGVPSLMKNLRIEFMSDWDSLAQQADSWLEDCVDIKNVIRLLES